ncbi:long-chain fatty acid--CoA ligase [Coleofasciculus sp. FACHB-64]|uniref:long-chain fatty acid--CoA ligase n=1 Tax=Cyanophyceae TaxID=3028117 RepID=UPI00168481CC|nr:MULTISPECIES: long-chain fatty acid--CoA ligase [unclassified Coleofasciculus]MBD1838060.1 long-chain fatty acid--CoA ligase [Coleofasciculus sp. FACHB-501]MBD2046246.1 long-chain fatty acid--CoA ligase [Coleofasciculus sp. FACHB-64]
MSKAPSSFQLSERDRANLSRMVDYSSVESLPAIWQLARSHFGNTIALHDPHAQPEVVINYTELAQQIQQFAAGLQALGVQPESRLALIADNSPRWFIADQGAMTAGAVDIVRSSQAEREELLFILADSGSTTLVVEDLKTLKKLRERLNDLPIQLVVLLSDEEPPEESTLKMLNFSGVMAAGENQSLQPVKQTREMLATLIYTSGTTGKPKGVMLTHGNLLHQITNLGTIVQPQPGEPVLTILPTWHSFGRTGEYFFLSHGCTQIYTSIRHIKKDFKEFQPHYLIAVPRLWESIYEGVQKQFREQPANKQKLVKNLLSISQRYIEARRTWQNLRLQPQPPSMQERLLAGSQMLALAPAHALAERLVYGKIREATGGKLKYLISGGGSLAMHLENFFEIIGLEVLVGYGLTETSPVLTARQPWCNLRGSSGRFLPGTEIKIVDPETRKPLPAGSRGLVLARGPQVMQGYYQNPQATAKAIDSEGWFDSGDLGWLTEANDLVLRGRAKDTIVLTNGENIEPQPIEDACLRSSYIDQIVLVGQDERSLGALIVPNLEALQKWAADNNLHLRLPEETSLPSNIPTASTQEIDLNSKIVQELFKKELNREVQNRPGYRPDDRISLFKLILEPFSIENGMMTQTLKIRRPVVMERYRDMIDGMFA